MYKKQYPLISPGRGSAVIIKNPKNIVKGVLLIRLLLFFRLRRQEEAVKLILRAVPAAPNDSVDRVCPPLLIKAGGNNRDADLIVHRLVERCAKDGGSVGMYGLLDQIGRHLHVLQADVHGAGA